MPLPRLIHRTRTTRSLRVAQGRVGRPGISTVGMGPVQWVWDQYSTVRYSTVRYGTVQSSTVRYSPVRYSPLQSSTVQSGTVRYSPVRYSPVQSGTVQSSPVLYPPYRYCTQYPLPTTVPVPVPTTPYPPLASPASMSRTRAPWHTGSGSFVSFTVSRVQSGCGFWPSVHIRAPWTCLGTSRVVETAKTGL